MKTAETFSKILRSSLLWESTINIWKTITPFPASFLSIIGSSHPFFVNSGVYCVKVMAQKHPESTIIFMLLGHSVTYLGHAGMNAKKSLVQEVRQKSDISEHRSKG